MAVLHVNRGAFPISLRAMFSFSRASFALVTGILLIAPVRPAKAGTTIAAKSVSFADVSSAVNLASNGDTVTVPAGTATWTSTLTITKNISLIGAGIGQTIITNNVPFNPGATTVFSLSVQTNTNLMRLSGMTILPGLTGPKNDSQAIISISGVSTVP